MITPQAFINYKNLVLNAKKGKTMITLEEFKKGKIAINTRTQEEYDNLMRFFDSKNIEWGSGDKATNFNYFDEFSEETTIRIRGGNTSLEHLSYWGEYHPDFGYKIITPNQLQEYNEFMGKPKYITTHAELLKLHGKSVTCKIDGVYVDDAKICVGGQGHNTTEMICICCSTEKDHGIMSPKELLGYKQAIWISLKCSKYEDNNRKCTELKLKEEAQYLTIGQAIDYMLESEDNVIEYYRKSLEVLPSTKGLLYMAKIKNGELKFIQEISTNGIWQHNTSRLDFIIEEWTKIRKYIEPKQKTLKDLIENKEPFEYKNNWYRFNKDGAIIDSKGSAIGIEFIKELLTIKENK
jgi:hypothetical protein